MKIRPFIFWPHLVCGVAIGLIVFSLSLTGLLLMFERQVTEWADRWNLTSHASDTAVLPLDELILRAAANGVTGTTIMVPRKSGEAIVVSEGRRRSSINPWDGTPIPPNDTVHGFYRAIESWHRWFAVDDTRRDTARPSSESPTCCSCSWR